MKTQYQYYENSSDAKKKDILVKAVVNDGEKTSYTYDENGNILTITRSDGSVISYGYDRRNQLIRENDPRTGKTIVYTYDAGGNLTTQKEYAYTTAATLSAAPTKTITATYSTAWKDQLLSWDGEAMTYDGSGNMLTKGSTTYTWERGRMLCGVNNGSTIRYWYDSNGMRTRKSVNGTVTDFCYAGSLLTSQTCGNTTFQKASLL